MSITAKKVCVLFSVVLCFCVLINVEAAEKKSADDYKAACRQVPVSDLTKKADQYKGKKVKYTGQILVMDFPQETKTGKTPYGIILSVKDDTHVLPSGVLPVYVTYNGSTDSFIYDNVTVYGEVYGNFEYKSATIQKKTLPRVDVKYLEKVK